MCLNFNIKINGENTDNSKRENINLKSVIYADPFPKVANMPKEKNWPLPWIQKPQGEANGDHKAEQIRPNNGAEQATEASFVKEEQQNVSF